MVTNREKIGITNGHESIKMYHKLSRIDLGRSRTVTNTAFKINGRRISFRSIFGTSRTVKVASFQADHERSRTQLLRSMVAASDLDRFRLTNGHESEKIGITNCHESI